MKTMLKVISLFLAAGVPGALAVELAGVSLPPMLDAIHMFAAFVAALVLLTVFADYQRATVIRFTTARMRTGHSSAKAVYPLAA